VSDRHANFFVADEGALAQDLYDLVWAVRRRVGEARNVWLEPEIQFVGEFRPSPDQGFGT
jgi:UDP-N-acetylenolpyruvoylglucosamine reductase